MSFLAFAILTKVYIWPRLRVMRRTDALIPLVIPHTFRFVGLSFRGSHPCCGIRGCPLVLGPIDPQCDDWGGEQAAVSRLGKPLPGATWIAASALTVSTAVTLAYVIGIVQVRPWYEPQYIIPIAGMILGNSMMSAALTGDRLQSDLRSRSDEIEARLALGFSGREALQPMVRESLRAAMIPTVNGMMTVGLVQLPGMMTGQILAGSSPLVAIRYQKVVVFMQGAATALGSLLFVRMAAGRYLTPTHQLRRYVL